MPASPRSIAPASASDPIAANPELARTNRQAASTLGPIDPAAKDAAAMASGDARRIGRAAGVPQSA